MGKVSEQVFLQGAVQQGAVQPSGAGPSGSAPLGQLVPPGRLMELSGDQASACTTVAVSAVRDAQHRGELVAWVQHEGGTLYPPDLEASGVDLRSLVCVRVPKGAPALLRATELLVRSGAIGLVVVDLYGSAPPAHGRWQARLAGVLRENNARLILLTHKGGSSLGPLISMRVEARRSRAGPERFAIEHAVLKAKLPLAAMPATEELEGPEGL